MRGFKVVIAGVFAVLAQGCASHLCSVRLVSAADTQWKVRACAVEMDQGADVQVTVHMKNPSTASRKIAAQPLRFSYGRAKFGEGTPTSWAAEGSATPAGEAEGYIEVAAGAEASFRRSFVQRKFYDYSPVARGEVLYLGTQLLSPTDATVSEVDLGEFVISVSEKGEILISTGREPMLR